MKKILSNILLTPFVIEIIWDHQHAL